MSRSQAHIKSHFLAMAESHLDSLREIRTSLERQLAEVTITIQNEERLIANLKAEVVK